MSLINYFVFSKKNIFCVLFLFLFSIQFNAQSIERPKILGLAHVSYKVSDIDKARKFYSALLGYEEAFTFYNADGSISVTFFKVNDRQYIELTPNLQPDQADRLNHFCFETDDIEKLKNYLSAKGITVPEKLTVGRDKNLHFTVNDPEGHLVEFVQILPGSTHSEAKGKFLYDKRISDRLLHTGITVKDINAVNKFYADVLGFSEFWRGGTNNSVISWIGMQIPESTDYIEYMIVDENMTVTRLHSAHHISLLVSDMQKSIETLRERPGGWELSSPRIGRNNRWLLNMFDHDGTRIELMEPHTVR